MSHDPERDAWDAALLACARNALAAGRKDLVVDALAALSPDRRDQVITKLQKIADEAEGKS